jgi:hypothetical protein
MTDIHMGEIQSLAEERAIGFGVLRIQDDVRTRDHGVLSVVAFFPLYRFPLTTARWVGWRSVTHRFQVPWWQKRWVTASPDPPCKLLITPAEHVSPEVAQSSLL